MKPKHVDLPEPASRAWKHATRLVDALLDECQTLEHERWFLSGGTALAAEWRHRTSTDIDILIAPGLSMAALEGRGAERLNRVITATGGTRINAPDQKLSVAYSDSGQVDIFSSGRQLPGHEQPIEVQGRTTERLSNGQIFARKFRRALEHQVAARDLFDICHAARTGDPGMQQALNALTQPELDRIRTFWESSRTKIEHEAAEKLSGTTRANWIEPGELVDRAGRTTDEHRYAQVLVIAGDNRATIRTKTAGGRGDEYRSTPANLGRDLEALGIRRYLMRRNINANIVIDEARAAMRESRERTVADTAGASPTPPGRRTPGPP